MARPWTPPPLCSPSSCLGRVQTDQKLKWILKTLTAGGCQGTALFTAEWQVLSWRESWGSWGWERGVTRSELHNPLFPACSSEQESKTPQSPACSHFQGWDSTVQRLKDRSMRVRRIFFSVCWSCITVLVFLLRTMFKDSFPGGPGNNSLEEISWGSAKETRHGLEWEGPQAVDGHCANFQWPNELCARHLVSTCLSRYINLYLYLSSPFYVSSLWFSQ